MPLIADKRFATKARPIITKEKPPFLVGDQRFSDRDVGLNSKDSPEYHCAYDATVDRPSRWDTKGWTSIDDAIKPKRGTSTGRLHSSMAPPTAPPQYGASIQPLQALYPNETRLQELLELQRRKAQHRAPPPGTYEAPVPPRRSTFRRPNHPSLDGPFFLGEGEDGHLAMSTRAKDIAALIRNKGDSGLGPGEYTPDVPAKEVTSLNRNPPSIKIGTSCRDGRAPPHAKSLSVSRSIQHGVNYKVPVIVQAPSHVMEAARRQQIKAQPPGDGAANLLGLKAPTSPGSGGHLQLGGVPDTAPSVHAPSGSPPRYMDPIHDTSPSRPARPVKLLPQPPANVVRAGIPRARAMQPGDWDWNKLGHNFRSTWTTSGGGAYSHGDRKHERRSQSPNAGSPPQPQSALSPQQQAADTVHSQLSKGWPAFGPDSSIDINKLPPTQTPIFPIPEGQEATHLYHDIGGLGHSSKPPSQRVNHLYPPPSQKADSRGSSNSSTFCHRTPTSPRFESTGPQGLHSQSFSSGQAPVPEGCGAADSDGAGVGAWGDIGANGTGEGGAGSKDNGKQHRGLGKSNSLLDLPGAANLLSPGERERHNEALQAAAVVQQINARQSDWLVRSTPPSSSQSRSPVRRS